MRAFRAIALTATLALAPATAGADPQSAPGFRLETVRVPGAILGGLSRDGDKLLVTDLASGRLYRRGADGGMVAFGPTLPHGLDVIGDPTGPYRVIRVGSDYVVAQGWRPVEANESAYDHALVAIGEDGRARVISDEFWNPFDFIVSGGSYYVVDSARNSIERVSANGTARETLHAFSRLDQAPQALRRLSPTEFSEQQVYETDAVPTGIALSDGRLFVALFGGFPFLPGTGMLVSIPTTDGARPRVEFSGLNAPVDVALDTKGRILVLEYGLFGLTGGFQAGSGRLLRCGPGHCQTILDGLTRPVSVLVWDDTRLVVSDLGGNLLFLRAAFPER